MPIYYVAMKKTPIRDRLNTRLRKRLLTIMADEQLTQSAMADRLGIPQSNLQRFLVGKRRLQLDTIENYAKQAGFTVGELF